MIVSTVQIKKFYINTSKNLLLQYINSNKKFNKRKLIIESFQENCSRIQL